MLRDQILVLKDTAQAKTELEDRVRKLERKLIVVQKDRDHYRTVNEMYESEMTRIGGNTLKVSLFLFVHSSNFTFFISPKSSINGSQTSHRVGTTFRRISNISFDYRDNTAGNQ